MRRPSKVDHCGLGPIAPAAGRVLATALVLLATGCQSLASKKTTTTEVASVPSVSQASDAPGQKTEFHKDPTPEQQFNVHVELARVYETQGNNEAAISEYQKAVDLCAKKGRIGAGSKIGPVQESVAQRRMAGCLDRMGRFAQAETHYLRALKLAPKDPKVWNDAGYSYYLQSRYADAERTLKTAEAMDPNNPRVLTNLGLTLAASGREDDALMFLTRAGGPAVGHANLGFIMAALGQRELARKHYQEALKIQPQLQAAKTAIAKLDGLPASPTGPMVASATDPNLITPAQDVAVTQASTTKPEMPSQPMPPLPAVATPARDQPASVPDQPQASATTKAVRSQKTVSRKDHVVATKPRPRLTSAKEPPPASNPLYAHTRLSALLPVKPSGTRPQKTSEPKANEMPPLPTLPEAVRDAGVKPTSLNSVSESASAATSDASPLATKPAAVQKGLVDLPLP